MELIKLLSEDYNNVLFILIGIVLVIVLYFYHTYKENKVEPVIKEKKVEFELDDQDDIIMYGKDSCPWCKRQKTELGEYWGKVKYVNCATDSGKCEEISALPTWVIKGERSEGFIKKSEFEKKCGL